MPNCIASKEDPIIGEARNVSRESTYTLLTGTRNRFILHIDILAIILITREVF